MADQTIPGTLSVTEKVGIRIEDPSAQLHIASPAGDPSEALIESGGVSLKLAVNATGAFIGTTNAFPLSMQTGGSDRITLSPGSDVTVAGPLTVQSALTATGNVSIGTDTTPATLEVKGNIQGRDATLTGPLTVGGNLLVTGTVDGRDVSADGQKLDSHIGITSGNPHGTTAAHIGALLASDLEGGAGITITPNQANRRITIAASGTQGLVSVDGVSNPGGNIDLVPPPGQAVVIEPDDTNNRITIRETHSAARGNVHGLEAKQIGALLASDYDLRQRGIATLPPFTAGDANNTSRTMNVGFRPRIVLVVGACTVHVPGNRTYGGGLSAFADLGNTFNQHCFGFGVTRFSNTDWFCHGIRGVGIICFLSFSNREVSQAENVTVAISSVSATGLTATMARSVRPPNASLFNFTIQLSLLCMG